LISLGKFGNLSNIDDKTFVKYKKRYFIIYIIKIIRLIILK